MDFDLFVQIFVLPVHFKPTAPFGQPFGRTAQGWRLRTWPTGLGVVVRLAQWFGGVRFAAASVANPVL